VAKENETESEEQGTMIEIVFSHDTHPQGIVFRMGGTKGTTRFSPYVWLNFCDYEIAGRTLKLDFSRYDVVLWAAENHSLEKLFGFTPCSQFAQLWIACLCYFSVPLRPNTHVSPPRTDIAGASGAGALLDRARV
jgi:hypothetical protein